jgi:hypothetical protein
MERFVRDSKAYKAWNVLSWLQPWAARLALAGCMFVFVCLSATWWTREANFAKVAAAYGAVSPHSGSALTTPPWSPVPKKASI